MVYRGRVTDVGETPRSAEHAASLLEFETLISDTSASLISVAPQQLDRVLHDSLRRVRDLFQADRCGLLSVSADGQSVRVRMASYSEGVSRVSDELNYAQTFPWSWQILDVRRAPVCISKLDDLPREADVDRVGFTAMATRSSLTAPIETDGIVGHLIVVHTVHEEREWPDPLLARLRVLGQMLVGALVRQEMFARLGDVEERLAMAADSAAAGLWILDVGTRVFWVTERTRAIFGFRPDEVVTVERFAASVHPDNRSRVREIIDRFARSQEPFAVEYRILMPHGDVRWLSSRGRSRGTSTHGSGSLMGVTIDISERKRAEQALRASEARLIAGADLAGLAFYEMDFAAGVMLADERLRDLCGFPADGDLGIEAMELWMANVHPADKPQVMGVRRRLFSGEAEQFAIEYRYLHPERGETWIHHLAGTAARDTDGRASRTYGVLRDITGRKRVEEELRDLSRRLIGAHEEERALLARELHDDVSQRLAVLAIDVGRVELTASDEAQATAMKAIRAGLVRLSEDIHSLAYQLHPSLLEELGLAEALRAECERRGREGSLIISMDLDPLPEGLSMDAALCLFRVAQEALTNVARHAGVSVASVALRCVEHGLRLTVHDDGAGFDMQSPVGGMHLGLASMRERVRLAGGTLQVESSPGQGTTIAAWVPAEEGASR
jgi:PAS domain S-box-containing protein